MFNRGCDGDTDKAVLTVSKAVLEVLFRHLGVKNSAFLRERAEADRPEAPVART
jgi:hypothetical protein